MKKESIVPMLESDKPDEIIKRDKKNLSILMIVGICALSVTILTAFISFIVYERTGYAFAALFLGTFVMVCFIVGINKAHNSSRRTAALLKIAESVTGKEAIPDEIQKEAASGMEKKKQEYIEISDVGVPAKNDDAETTENDGGKE